MTDHIDAKVAILRALLAEFPKASSHQVIRTRELVLACVEFDDGPERYEARWFEVITDPRDGTSLLFQPFGAFSARRTALEHFVRRGA